MSHSEYVTITLADHKPSPNGKWCVICCRNNPPGTMSWETELWPCPTVQLDAMTARAQAASVWLDESAAQLAAALALVEQLHASLTGLGTASNDGDERLCWCPTASTGWHTPACHRARAALAGQTTAAIRCPDCLQSASTAAEIDHGDGCEAAHG